MDLIVDICLETPSQPVSTLPRAGLTRQAAAAAWCGADMWPPASHLRQPRNPRTAIVLYPLHNLCGPLLAPQPPNLCPYPCPCLPVQLRLPALLLAHGLLMASVFVRAPLIPDQGLGAPVLGRLAALLLGLVLDARRRGRFMREQQPKLGQGLPGRDTGHVSGAGKATGTEAVDTPGEREEGNQGLRQQVGTSTSTLVRRRGGH
jgi:hypothetical protein